VFLEIPITNKTIIRNDYKRFTNYKLSNLKIDNSFESIDYNGQESVIKLADKMLIAEYTSGSDGIPFMVIKSFEERIKLGMNLWKLRNTFHPASSEKMLYFIHKPKFINYPVTFFRNENNTTSVCDEIDFIDGSQYTWWHTCTRLLDAYMNIISKNEIECTFENLRVIENNAAFLSDKNRKKYEMFYGCKVANNYGCREIWNIAFDCREQYLHINEEVLFFELIDDNDSVITEPNKYGKIVLTSYYLKEMPFIRYAIGDSACYLDGTCKCGRNTRRIKLQGERNIIIGSNGLNGDEYFTNVVYGVTFSEGINFDSILVTQIGHKKFLVNIKGNHNNKSIIEQSFTQLADEYIPISDCEYLFTYNNEFEQKSIFQARIESA